MFSYFNKLSDCLFEFAKILNNMEEPNIICSNCDKPIAESKHVLHESYCMRNNRKCEICKEVFGKTDIESHKETHKKMACEHCKL